WIPYIEYLIRQRKTDHIYINEVLIGKSILPTKTDINKTELIKLSNDKLQKKGDLDTYAHKNKNYPSYIIEEINIIKKAINEIITEHSGKKIAIVSDHGLSYLSQLRDGYNLAGITSDHNGRLAVRTTDKCVADSKYKILDDGNNTICALQHNSLCGKIPFGQGAHGGCTPEEVLIPIIIISSQKNASNWTATMPNNEISDVNPIARFKIKGLVPKDNPYVIYNGDRYEVSNIGDEEYKTQSMNLDSSKQNITLIIGDKQQVFHIKLNLGGETEDLFGDF
ncbi:MAG: BREX-4 system phosphatase PglZ, partial [Muribaculaceae bacterium]